MAHPIKVDIQEFSDEVRIEVSQGKHTVMIYAEQSAMEFVCGFTELGGVRVEKVDGPKMSQKEKYALAGKGLKKVLIEGYSRSNADYSHRVCKFIASDVVGGMTSKSCKGMGFTVSSAGINPKTGRKLELYEFGITPSDVKGIRRRSKYEPYNKSVICSYLNDTWKEGETKEERSETSSHPVPLHLMWF